jgi:DNA mismatch repair ATPase MutS
VLTGLATLAVKQNYRRAELTDEPVLEAEHLGHPLIDPTSRVSNDVALEGPGHALVVTGSNMSGKSTLLRALGINVVLANAGAPVCAKRLRLGSLRVATSMRVSDSLEEGTSRFYAELKKLRLVLELARAAKSGGPAVLFLLDEILHGTNTRERVIGARAILRELIAQHAMGAVSTHDLALGDLESELEGRVKNVHFEEQVEGDVMTFDYRLRAGVVQSSNALRLMKIVGLDVVAP